MTGLVLDASVVLKWFRDHGEAHIEAARSIRVAFQAGWLVAYAPSLLTLEILNTVGRRWGWAEPRLIELVEALDEIGIIRADPEPSRVAYWTAMGLTAYDATYVALAEAEGVRLVTDDDRILTVAPEVAVPLSGVGRLLAEAVPPEPATGDEPPAPPQG